LNPGSVFKISNKAAKNAELLMIKTQKSAELSGFVFPFRSLIYFLLVNPAIQKVFPAIAGAKTILAA
jgi:hypothetical protein